MRGETSLVDLQYRHTSLSGRKLTVWQNSSVDGSGTVELETEKSGSINPCEPTMNSCGPHLIQPSMSNGYVWMCMHVCA